MRTAVAVDRLIQNAVAHSAACVEFEPAAGLWCVVRFLDHHAASNWNDRVRAAFRLLADSGFGGRRRSGWGQTEAPEFQTGDWPALLFPKLARQAPAAQNGSSASLYWVLSLFSPSPADSIDWKAGSYDLLVRGGRTESNGAQKKRVRMIAEGSVLSATAEPVGSAVDVAPDGFAHPVYRFGVALALKLPEFAELSLEGAQVEAPADLEAPEPEPCPQPAETVLEPETQPEPSATSEQTPEPEPQPESTPESAQEPEQPHSEPGPPPEFEPALPPEIEPHPAPEPEPEKEPGDEL